MNIFENSKPSLPETGFIRASDLVRTKNSSGLLSISRATLWRMVRDHRFPQPVKLSTRCTAWRVEGVREWMESR